MAEVLQSTLDPLHPRERRFCTLVHQTTGSRRSGAAAAPPTPALEATGCSDDRDRRRQKKSRSETTNRSRSHSRERRPRRHGGLRRSRFWSTPSRWPRHVDSYYGDQYVRNPMTSPSGPPFQYGATYGYLPAHSGAATPAPAPTYRSLPPALGHSLPPSPGNGPATYPSLAGTPEA